MTEPFLIGLFTSDPVLRLKVLEAQVKDNRQYLYTILALLSKQIIATNNLLGQIHSLIENVAQREEAKD
jgi:hypothetical protein